MRILVVGGGIAGLTLATSLRRCGCKLQLIERAAAWAPVGAGIVLGVNAMAVLRRLGLGEPVTAVGREVQRASITDSRGRRLITASFAPLRQEFGPTFALHRADLHRVLVAAAGDDSVQLGTALCGLTEDGEGVVAATSDGREERYDVVVGADGIRSPTRALAISPQQPTYAGYTCWRFVVEAVDVLEETVEMWGRGQRVGLVPLRGRSVYGFAVANAPAGSRDADALASFRERFAEFGGPASSTLAQVMTSDQLIANDLEEIELPTWHRGRVVLIGDAAHAMTPNLGQGAAMAIEDAFVLAEELGRHTTPTAAFLAFEARRRRRVTSVQRESRRVGRIGQWSHPAACILRAGLARLAPGQALLRGAQRLAATPI